MSSARAIARRAAFRLATSDRVERIVVDTPPLRALAYKRAERYVAGPSVDDALATVKSLASEGMLTSVDLFGENVADEARADSVVDEYLELARALGAAPGAYLSLDCSHVGLDVNPSRCRDRVKRIARALPQTARLQLGAEESSRTDAILAVARAVARDGLPIMVTVQANLRRSAADIEALAREGIPIRLVKGAYVEADEVALPWGIATDAEYVRLAKRLAELEAEHALATHDMLLLRQLLSGHPQQTIEFLLGVRTNDARQYAQLGHAIRIYVPYGERWFRYYARRAAESVGA